MPKRITTCVCGHNGGRNISTHHKTCKIFKFHDASIEGKTAEELLPIIAAQKGVILAKDAEIERLTKQGGSTGMPIKYDTNTIPYQEMYRHSPCEKEVQQLMRRYQPADLVVRYIKLTHFGRAGFANIRIPNVRVATVQTFNGELWETVDQRDTVELLVMKSTDELTNDFNAEQHNPRWKKWNDNLAYNQGDREFKELVKRTIQMIQDQSRK